MSHDNTCMKHLLASLTVCSLTIISGEVIAQDSADHVEHHAHEADEGEGHAEDMSEESEETTPALPEGMTLEETLQRAAKPPPSSFPEAIHDDKVKFFWLADQFEYRLDSQRERDVFGMEAMFWAGGDINRLQIDPELEAGLDPETFVESETDILYSRLFAPFWSGQVGVSYRNNWGVNEGYNDLWSAVASIQGVAPGKFEVSAAMYMSRQLDFSAIAELEYDLRITQRLVLQPRTELSFSFQDIPAQNVGAGLSNVNAGLRLRYEIARQFAPYLGARFQARTFESAERAEAAGDPVRQGFIVAGVRFAFL